jgi:hypothetical protein
MFRAKGAPMPHGLSDLFVKDLKEGFLKPLLERVKDDPTLCLEIREEYINIYYRGGSLLRVSAEPFRYAASFDPNYARGDGSILSAKPAESLRNSEDVANWLGFFPMLKHAMDLFFGQNLKEEREAEQNILRQNNFGGGGLKTDYFICDMEYANKYGQFDLVAVNWPSKSAVRKIATGRRLVIVEAKFGEGALDGDSGLHAHINDINEFLSSDADVRALKREMVGIFKQKWELGLMNCKKNLEAFSDEEKPMLLLALVNHDPDSIKLRRCLESLPPSPNADIYLATSCFMGYGLFDQGVLPLEVAKERLDTLICSRPKESMEVMALCRQ